MRRFFLILGIVLMVLAFAILTIFIIAPSVVTLDDAPFLKNIMQALVCKPGEELSASYSTYSTPGTTTRSTDMSCVNNERQERDASSQIITIGAVGYLVPFLVGLFMSLIAGNQFNKNSYKSPRKKRPNLTGIDDSFVPETPHVPLAQQLQELKEAYNAGLITEAEYKAKRAAILKE